MNLRTVSTVGLVGLSLLLGGCATSSGDGGGGSDAAQSRCEDYIKTLLKAPSTADFHDEVSVDNGDKTWNVTGSVDAENSFSAKIRSTWQCVARDAGDDMWSVDSGSVNDAP